MEVYLDHAATTWVYEEVAETVKEIMCKEFGNPSSMHMKGVEAERMVKESAKKIAGILKVQEKEIYFTSGGTESNNWALIGCAQASKKRGKRIITSKIEHASVSSPMKFLEDQGFEIIRIGCDKNGIIDTNALREAINEETILVSVMMVNNEVGSVQPIEEISKIIKNANKNTVFHVDAIQAFGKLKIFPKKLGIDMLSVSGHKIHAPKGTGFLYISDKTRILPLIYGGGQQNGMRSGTDNVPGIVGLAQAAEIMYNNFSDNTEHMKNLRERLITGLKGLDEVQINGPLEKNAAPHIVNASFLGIRSEVLLHVLEDKEIYVSAGSACSSHKRAPSAVLSAIGCEKAALESALRFSLCERSKEEEIDRVIEVLQENLPALRRYTRH